jgi:hypothetical protein
MLSTLAAIADLIEDRQEALAHILRLLEGLEVRIKEAIEAGGIED